MRKNEAEAFAEVTTHLLQRFPGVPEDHVSLLVESERQRLADARIREFLPLLAERAATRHLRTELAGVAR